MTKTKEQPTSDREIVVSRVIDATRERVWRALTEPKELDAWWGPNGFKNLTKEWDFKPGGLWKHVMIGPDGAEYPNTTRFVEIERPDHIVYENAGGKKGGRGVSFQMTWTLKDVGGKTELTIRHVFQSREDRDFVADTYRAVEGGRQTLAKLAKHAADKPEFELRLERVIDAPLARVFDAWSKPEQIVKWFAPRPLTLEIASLEFRAAGSFRMAMVWPDGKQRHDFAGTYVEIVPRKKIVWTGEFPGDPKDNIRTEVLFEDLKGKTRISVRQTFVVVTEISKAPTQGARQGWTMTLDQLAAFVTAGAS